VDQWALWGKALWRAAAPCVAVVVLLAICHLMLPKQHESLSQDLENTVYSAGGPFERAMKSGEAVECHFGDAGDLWRRGIDRSPGG